MTLSSELLQRAENADVEQKKTKVIVALQTYDNGKPQYLKMKNLSNLRGQRLESLLIKILSRGRKLKPMIIIRTKNRSSINTCINMRFLTRTSSTWSGFIQWFPTLKPKFSEHTVSLSPSILIYILPSFVFVLTDVIFLKVFLNI